MIKTNIYLFFFSIIFLTSCRINGVYVNREEDKKEAEVVADKLFRLIKNKDYDGTIVLFSDRFFQVSGRDKLLEIYKITNQKLGKLQSINLEKWETKRVEGTNPSAEYTFLYKTTYDNFQAEETIRLTKESNGEIKILAYNVNSEGFLR